MFSRLTHSRSSSLRTLIAIVAVFLAVSALFGGRLASAQDDEPHLAHIHPGTCDDLNPEPEYPLEDVSTDFQDEDGPLAGDSVGSIDPTQEVEGSITVIDALTIDDLTGDEPYAVNLHESAENAATYIACGNVAGTLIDEHTLAVPLAEQNDSGHSGFAVLTNIDGGLRVTVYLTHSDADADAGTDDVTPDADDADDSADDADETEDAADDSDDADDADDSASAAGDEAIAIQDFAFDPDDLTIPVGTTVTWTNNDGAPHTVTADDGSFDSGNLGQGDTFTFTFEEAGTFTYICKIHPSMTATITVE